MWIYVYDVLNTCLGVPYGIMVPQQVATTSTVCSADAGLGRVDDVFLHEAAHWFKEVAKKQGWRAQQWWKKVESWLVVGANN
jgi:hypothetical protein